MGLAGVHGEDHPSLDVLALAEAPPEADWRAVWPNAEARAAWLRPDPAHADFRQEAERLVASRAWRERQTGIKSRPAQVFDAIPEAVARLMQERMAFRPGMVMVNQSDHDRGQAAAARWRPVLDVLAGMLDAVEASIPDAWLASVTEEELQTAAAAAGRLGFLTTPAHLLGTPKARRAGCEKHHRKALRRRAGKARQHVSALLGTVGQGGAAYADPYAVACWKERQAAARAFGQSRLLAFEGGATVPLWNVMETSRKARLAALYAQALGLDDLAQRRGMVPVFVTITLPPEHHPNPAHGQPYAGADWKDAPSPEETDSALGRTWTLFRARAAADLIDLLGLRVIEPHRDGTPHLHALLYLKDDDQARKLDRYLQALCPEPVAGRRIASKLVRLDRSKASPTTYVMKYLMKSMPAWEAAAEHADGQERDGDPDHLAYHTEVAAWRSERGLRGFAWLGMHGLRTAWQRVRSMSEDELAAAPDRVRQANAAMLAGAWGDAVEAMGVVRSDRVDRLRLDYVTKQNAYGEPVRRPDGVTMGEWRIPLKRRTCQVARAPAPDRNPPTNPAPDSGPTEPWDSNPVTVTVSCPRGDDQAGEDGNPRSTAGPTRRHKAAAAPVAAHEPHLQPEVSRTRVERAERAANPRRRLRTTPDDIDRMADRALAASRGGLAKAVSFEGYKDAPEGCF